VRTSWGLPAAPFEVGGAYALSSSFGRSLSWNASTTRVTPIATAQMPPTMISAASVAPGDARARTPSGTSTRPNSSSSHQSPRTLRAANAPEMLIVPITISHEPRKMPSTVRLGDGQAMVTMPAATESNPVTTLAARLSMPVVSITAKPSKMNRAPMKAARLLDAPIDAEDQDAGEDQQQAIDEQLGPVAGKALGGGVGQLTAKRVE
jgi:hypothetical protein